MDVIRKHGVETWQAGLWEVVLLFVVSVFGFLCFLVVIVVETYFVYVERMWKCVLLDHVLACQRLFVRSVNGMALLIYLSTHGCEGFGLAVQAHAKMGTSFPINAQGKLPCINPNFA